MKPQSPPFSDQIIEFGTKRQQQVLRCIKKHKYNRVPASKELGITHRRVCRIVDIVKKRAALQGIAPENDLTRQTAPGFSTSRVSTLYNSQGEIAAQWHVQKPQQELAIQTIFDSFEDIANGIKGKSRLVRPPKAAEEDLLAVYPIGDQHVGLFSWHEETGEDFDIKEVERVLAGAIDALAATTESAGTALLLNLGDYFHNDNNTNQTPASGNALDVDTRFAKILRVGTMMLRHAIHRLLQRHRKVVVWNMPGNHDPTASIFLSLCLRAYFENNPRVDVCISPNPYKYLRFGKVMIGSHHGHGAKQEELPGIMAADQSEDWGKTKYRYFYTGHIHHRKAFAREFTGCEVESFNTLAAKDAWHNMEGYRAQRNMKSIVHHREFGEWQRNTRCVAVV